MNIYIIAHNNNRYIFHMFIISIQFDFDFRFTNTYTDGIFIRNYT